MGSPLFDKGVHSLGRSGGDGLLRLWGTKAAGSYGEIARITNRKSPSNGTRVHCKKSSQTPIIHTVHEFSPCKESNRKNLKKLIENNDNSSILYIGKSKNRTIERICGDTSKGFVSSHFTSGVNSILLELLQKRRIEGEVIALPVVNFSQASTTMSDQTEIMSLIFEAVLASVLSIDKALNIEEGNSTNIAPCGGIGFFKGTFNRRFTELIEYKEKHGDCAVPVDTPGLGLWVTRQRKEYKKFLANSEDSSLTEDQIKKLDDVGFIWDHHEDAFNFRFMELIEYKEKYGNCAVPAGTPGLGFWVKTQRQEHKKFLGKTQRCRLHLECTAVEEFDDNTKNVNLFIGGLTCRVCKL